MELRDLRLRSKEELIDIIKRLELSLRYYQSSYSEGFNNAVCLFKNGLNHKSQSIPIEYVYSIPEVEKIWRKK